MDENRAFPRYKVQDVSELRVEIENNKGGEHLVTMGEGGCGFYGFQENPRLIPVRRISCRFAWGTDEWVEVQGQLLYARTVPVNDSKVIFYGIEFIAAHRVRVQPLIQKIQSLAEQGKVQVA